MEQEEFGIFISKSKIRGIQFSLDDENKMKWQVSVDLLTHANEKVTSLCVSDNEYMSSVGSMEIPKNIEVMVRRIFSSIGPKVAQKIMRKHDELEAPKSTDEAQVIDL